MRRTEKVKGIVLAGTYQWGETAFETLLPRPLVPVAQVPLISYTLEWLRDGGVTDATICANSAGRAVREHFGEGRGLGMTLGYYEDWSPRGPAGCARDASLQSDADTYVIADGTVIPTVNLEGLLETHAVCQAVVTVLVHHEPGTEHSSVSSGRDLHLRPARLRLDSRRWLPGHQGNPHSRASTVRDERIVTHTAYGACPRVLELAYLPRRQPLDGGASGPAAGTTRGPRGSGRGSRAQVGPRRRERAPRRSGPRRARRHDRRRSHDRRPHDRRGVVDHRTKARSSPARWPGAGAPSVPARWWIVVCSPTRRWWSATRACSARSARQTGGSTSRSGASHRLEPMRRAPPSPERCPLCWPIASAQPSPFPRPMMSAPEPTPLVFLLAPASEPTRPDRILLKYETLSAGSRLSASLPGRLRRRHLVAAHAFGPGTPCSTTTGPASPR